MQCEKYSVQFKCVYSGQCTASRVLNCYFIVNLKDHELKFSSAHSLMLVLCTECRVYDILRNIVYSVQCLSSDKCPFGGDYLFLTVQYSTVQYSTVQYSTVQYSTVQYCILQF